MDTQCVRGCVDNTENAEPVTAVMGLLCQRCFNRLWWRLGDVPATLEQVMLSVTPGGSAGERVAGTKDYDVLNDQALTDADQLWALIMEWAKWFAMSSGVARPEALGTLLADERDVAGVSVRATPAQAAREAHSITGWLQSHLEGFAYDSSISVMHDSVTELVAQLGGRYGLRERKLTYRRRICPVCVEGRVRASWVEDELQVKCEYCWTEWPVTAEELQGVLQGA